MGWDGMAGGRELYRRLFVCYGDLQQSSSLGVVYEERWDKMQIEDVGERMEDAKRGVGQAERRDKHRVDSIRSTWLEMILTTT
jgi:hypothetical protein